MKVVSYHGKVTVEHETSHMSVKVSPCKKKSICFFWVKKVALVGVLFLDIGFLFLSSDVFS